MKFPHPTADTVTLLIAIVVFLLAGLFNAYRLGKLKVPAKVIIYKALLLIFFCIPFSYLCVMGDAKFGTMAFYGVMIAGFALLCIGALKTRNIAILYIGNVLSFFSSLFFVKVSGLNSMDWYFKPFTADSLMIFISVSALLVQTAIVLINRKHKEGEK